MKYLIVSTGRSGSTFLSAILSKAGAHFGLDGQDNWDRSSGSYEHPKLDRAYKWHRAAEEIHQEIWPLNRISSFFESRRDAILQDVFNNANYAKTIELVHLIQPIHQLEIELKIIFCFRSFNGFATSQYRRFGWGLDNIENHYRNVNKTALLQLQIFGGCAVSFQDLIDPDETEWAEPLGELTSLNKGSLLEYREQLLEPRRHNPINQTLSKPAEELYDQIAQLKGSVIPSTFVSSSS